MKIRITGKLLCLLLIMLFVFGSNASANSTYANGSLMVDANTTALWRFDEGTGTTVYDSANSYDGYLHGNWESVNNIYGDSDLNSSLGGVRGIVAPFPTTNGSIEMFFSLYNEFNESGSQQDLFDWNSVNIKLLSDGSLQGYVFDNHTARILKTTQKVWNASTIYKVALTWSNENGTILWLNDSNVAEDVFNEYIDDTTESIGIGTWRNGNSYLFDGIISDTRISDIDRTGEYNYTVVIEDTNANYTFNPATPSVIIEDGDITWDDLNSILISTYGETVTKSTWMNETEPNVWLVKCKITTTNATLTINETFGTEYRLGYKHTSGGLSYGGSGAWNVSNVKFSTWDLDTNLSSNAGNRRAMYGANSSFTNFIYDTFGSWYIGAAPGLFTSTDWSADNVILNNVTCTNWSSAIYLYGDYMNFQDVYMHDADFITGSSGIRRAIGQTDKPSYSTFKNIRIVNIGDGNATDSSSTYAFQLYGDHNIVDGVYAENIQYSSYNVGGEYNSYKNMTSVYSSHNAFEAQARNSTYENILIMYAQSDASWFTSLYDGGSNVTITNLTIVGHNGTGHGIRLLGEMSPLTNYVFDGIDFVDKTTSLLASGVHDSVFINVTNINSSVFTWSTSNTSVLSDNNTLINWNNNQNIELMKVSDMKLANVKYSDARLSTYPSSYTNLYPLNVQVINNTNYSVSGATVTLNLTTFGLNGYGQTTVTGITDDTGKLNLSQRLYVPDYNRDSSIGYTYYLANTVQADKSGKNDESSAFNPDISWYSTNLSSLNSPLITLVLDVPGTVKPTEDTVDETTNITSPISNSGSSGYIPPTSSPEIPTASTVTNNYTFWSLLFLIGIGVIISGLTDTNPMFNNNFAFIIGLFLVIVSADYLAILPDDIKQVINSIVSYINTHAA